MGQQTALTDINLPEPRMVGRAPDQRWQWKFGSDNQWRDMMQTIPSNIKQKKVTKLPDWLGGKVLKEGPLIDVSGGKIFGEVNLLNKALEWTFPALGDDYVQAVVDFEELAGKTDLLPANFEQTASK